MDNKEYRKDISPDEVSYIIAVIKGGGLSQLFEDSKYIRHCVNNVIQFIDDRLLTK